VHQGRGLQRRRFHFAAQMRSRELLQFLVNQRDDSIERGAISGLKIAEQRRDLRRHHR
jgi:hypothetical protein